jgi:hypothetical protein
MNWQPAGLGLVAGCLQRAGIGSVRPPQGPDHHLLGRSLGVPRTPLPHSPTRPAQAPALLPPVTDLRTVSAAVTIAVASTADEHGLAEQPLTDPVRQIHQAMWRPDYPPFEPL